MTARVKSLQEQQRLILSAAPRGLQVDEKRSHAPTPGLLWSASISFPSFAYFRRTERAAICAINAPRYLRLPASNIWRAASVVYRSTLDSCSANDRTV